MQMKLPKFLLALALVVPASAAAGPITPGGMWSPTPKSNDLAADTLEFTPFWSGLSWDCDDCGVGYLIGAYGDSGLEYLHNGSGGFTKFRFDDEFLTPTYLGGMTAWKNGVFGRREDGAFTYDSGTGRVSNSWDFNTGQYALFRLVGEETITYFLGIEDILLTERFNDRDYNDYIVTFTTPTPVPEPSTMLLLGSSMAALAVRKRLAARKRRARV
jgi:hypothetical protein